MYTDFTKTSEGGYSLKKQGIISAVFIGGSLAALAIFCLKAYFKTQQGNLLFLTFFMLACCLFVIWRNTKQFIIYPQQQIFKYSKGLGSSFHVFHFSELDGASQENIKNMYGFTTGNSFKLGFEQNGKYKEVLLAQNVSAKKMRSITEEMNQIMGLK